MYRLECQHKNDIYLFPFFKDIENICVLSEFQYLTKGTLFIEIPNENKFDFQDCYFINNKVLIFENSIWQQALSLFDTDGIFTIPIVIKHCGEKHNYYIVVPPRIKCLDLQGKIMIKNVGRYHIFKSEDKNDLSIYFSENMMKILSIFPALIFKRS